MKTRYKIILTVIVLLVIARILLPHIVLFYANKSLATLKGYYGHIDDIDISLWRGAYQVKVFDVKKIDDKDTIHFVYVRYADLAIEWKPLFRGSLVGKVLVDSCDFQVTKDKNDINDIAKDTGDFRVVLKHFMPITLNRFEVTNSVVRYRDYNSKPNLNLFLSNLSVVALNMANAYDSTKVLPSSIRAHANLYAGDFNLLVRLDPLAEKPTFDMDVKLTETNLELVNDFLRAYINTDVNNGTFSLFSEFAAKDGKFNGYLKPMLKDIDVVSWNKEEGNLLQIAWESLVATIIWTVTNHKEDQLATKLYIDGSFEKPNVQVGKAIITILKNAFVEALKPMLDREISLRSLADDKRAQRKEHRKERKEAKKEEKERKEDHSDGSPKEKEKSKDDKPKEDKKPLEKLPDPESGADASDKELLNQKAIAEEQSSGLESDSSGK